MALIYRVIQLTIEEGISLDQRSKELMKRMNLLYSITVNYRRVDIYNIVSQLTIEK